MQTEVKQKSAKVAQKCVMPDWVIVNMRVYGNSLIAGTLVKRYGEDTIIDALKNACGKPVTMRRAEDMRDTNGKIMSRPCWIAEVPR